MATTKKPTATADAPVEEYDFDAWNDEAEAQAILALTPDIRHIIVEKNFIGRFPDGAIVKLPLEISLDDIERLSSDFPNPVDQVKALLDTMGGEDAVREFSRHNMTDTIVMADRFFSIFSRIAGASLPES